MSITSRWFLLDKSLTWFRTTVSPPRSSGSSYLPFFQHFPLVAYQTLATPRDYHYWIVNTTCVQTIWRLQGYRFPRWQSSLSRLPHSALAQKKMPFCLLGRNFDTSAATAQFESPITLIPRIYLTFNFTDWIIKIIN